MKIFYAFGIAILSIAKLSAQCIIDVTADVTTISEGESAVLTASGADSYSWSPPDGLNQTTGDEVVASPVITTTYTAEGACEWLSLDGGLLHHIALRPDGTLWGWGSGTSGQLGNGGTDTFSVPAQIGSASDWQMVAAGNYFSFGIKTDGTLWAWGENLYGQLGQTDILYQVVPIQVGTDTDWVDVACGARHTLLQKSDGTLWACGENAQGQLGIGSFDVASGIVQVNFIDDCVAMDAQGFHNLAMRSDGTIWSWGDNAYGQLGMNGVDQGYPVQIGMDTDWQKIVAGYYHNMAIKNDGSLWGWGNNVSSQLGEETVDLFQFEPLQIGDQNNWSDVSCGFSHTIALRDGDNLWAWGRNQEGQLGNGNNSDQAFPIYMGSGWTDLFASNECSFGTDTDNYRMAWGVNDSGQLGINTFTNTNLPTMVIGSSGSDSVTITVLPSYIGESTSSEDLLIVPNPVSSSTQVRISERYNGATWMILDITGRVINSGKVLSNQFSLTDIDLAAGRYAFVVSMEGLSTSAVVVVE